MQLYGGMETGGTKIVCAVAEHPTATPVDTLTYPTTVPDETIPRAIAFFKRHAICALGVASFGPVDIHPKSSTYGYVTTTPKANWGYTDLLTPLRQALNVPMGFDLDVNGAALGEWRYGAGQGLDSVLYITVGTGIGGGVVVGGKLLRGLTHPEMGHIHVCREPGDTYKGGCVYHGDCLEGMACGPAIAERWGCSADELGADHQAWQWESSYLAQAICAIIYSVSPQRIIMGGGVMHQPQLFPLIRERVVKTLHGYLNFPEITRHMDTYIVPTGLGDRSGAVGALEMARIALENAR